MGKRNNKFSRLVLYLPHWSRVNSEEVFQFEISIEKKSEIMIRYAFRGKNRNNEQDQNLVYFFNSLILDEVKVEERSKSKTGIYWDLLILKKLEWQAEELIIELVPNLLGQYIREYFYPFIPVADRYHVEDHLDGQWDLAFNPEYWPLGEKKEMNNEE